jgi:hypothetical protein
VIFVVFFFFFFQYNSVLAFTENYISVPKEGVSINDVIQLLVEINDIFGYKSEINIECSEFLFIFFICLKLIYVCK